MVRELNDKGYRILATGEMGIGNTTTSRDVYKRQIVKGYRGVHGGYSLNRGLDELTLFEVYSAIDPEMFIIECLDPKYNCVRDGQGGIPCLVHRELLSVQDELISLLKRKTIQQIMEEA